MTKQPLVIRHTEIVVALYLRVAMRTHFRQARLDDKGIDFRLGSGTKPMTRFFPWNEIVAVMHRHLPMHSCVAAGMSPSDIASLMDGATAGLNRDCRT